MLLWQHAGFVPRVSRCSCASVPRCLGAPVLEARCKWQHVAGQRTQLVALAARQRTMATYHGSPLVTASPDYGRRLHRLDYTYQDSRMAESRFGSGIALYFWFFRFLIQVTAVVWFVPRPPLLPPGHTQLSLLPPCLSHLAVLTNVRGGGLAGGHIKAASEHNKAARRRVPCLGRAVFLMLALACAAGITGGPWTMA